MTGETIDKAMKNLKRREAWDAFDDTSREAFSNLTDKELADIQSRFEPYDPQYILASHEWNVRLLNRQLKSASYSTWAGVLGTLGGVLLGAILAHLLR